MKHRCPHTFTLDTKFPFPKSNLDFKFRDIKTYRCLNSHADKYSVIQLKNSSMFTFGITRNFGLQTSGKRAIFMPNARTKWRGNRNVLLHLCQSNQSFCHSYKQIKRFEYWYWLIFQAVF